MDEYYKKTAAANGAADATGGKECCREDELFGAPTEAGRGGKP